MGEQRSYCAWRYAEASKRPLRLHEITPKWWRNDFRQISLQTTDDCAIGFIKRELACVSDCLRPGVPSHNEQVRGSEQGLTVLTA